MQPIDGWKIARDALVKSKRAVTGFRRGRKLLHYIGHDGDVHKLLMSETVRLEVPPNVDASWLYKGPSGVYVLNVSDGYWEEWAPDDVLVEVPLEHSDEPEQLPGERRRQGCLH